LLEAIKQTVENQENSNGLGDYSCMLDVADPFRDGKAAFRIGFYMNDLLESMDQNLGKATAMEKASKEYCKIYGNDKVDIFDR